MAHSAAPDDRSNLMQSNQSVLNGKSDVFNLTAAGVTIPYDLRPFLYFIPSKRRAFIGWRMQSVRWGIKHALFGADRLKPML